MDNIEDPKLTELTSSEIQDQEINDGKPESEPEPIPLGPETQAIIIQSIN